MHNLSDNQLVAAWRAGTEGAESELSNRHRAALVKSISTRIGDVEATELIADAAFADALETFNPANDAFFCCLLLVAHNRSDELIPPIIKLAERFRVPGYDTQDAVICATLKAKLLQTPEGRAQVAKWRPDDEHPLRELLAAIDANDNPFELGLVARYLVA